MNFYNKIIKCIFLVYAFATYSQIKAASIDPSVCQNKDTPFFYKDEKKYCFNLTASRIVSESLEKPINELNSADFMLFLNETIVALIRLQHIIIDDAIIVPENHELNKIFGLIKLQNQDDAAQIQNAYYPEDDDCNQYESESESDYDDYCEELANLFIDDAVQQEENPARSKYFITSLEIDRLDFYYSAKQYNNFFDTLFDIKKNTINILLIL